MSLCLALLLAATVQEPPLTIAEPPAADPSGGIDRIATGTDKYDRMTVPVTLGGQGPFRFLVDTGTDRTVLSHEIAARLGLEVRNRAIIHSASGQSRAPLAAIPEMRLSKRSLTDVSAPLLLRADLGADGILGIDTLRAHRVLFDFRGRALTIVSTDSPVSREERDAIIVRARRMEGRLVVTDARAAGGPVDVVLDTGSQLSVGNAALRRQLDRRGMLRSLGPTELVSVTGKAIPGELAIARELVIGDITLSDVVIVFADAHTFRELRLAGQPALLLGMNLLSSFDLVSIDFGSRKLRLVLPEAARAAYPAP